jgi:ribosomal protein L12E/L44/L45/RPP1/RPP2
MAWKPTLVPGAQIRELNLSPVETLIATRVDGTTDAAGLAHLTGLPQDRVEEILERLVTAGAVASHAGEAPQQAEPQEPLPQEDEAPEEPEEAPEDPGTEATHRKLFETTLHHLEVDVREARARDAVDPELTAFCFDPASKVIQALLDNPRTGLTQARLIAAHHRNPVGLESMSARAAFAADAGVRRNLLKNPQLPVGLMRRLWSARRLLEQWKLTISRELPEQTRRTARELLRQRFASGPAEERVELIMKTEGRCLQLLTGLAIDSKTTALLCGRTYSSTLFIQNLARWSAAPPPLIAHLLRQEAVRRSPMLRTLLQRHPNAPSGK